nr:diacylglycerol kinase family protein [Treponema bryantii]
MASDEADTESIIVTAGGDGTSLEVQTALFKEAMQGPKHHDAITNHITILRLPLGTGNDGTDGHKIEETIELLRGGLVFANERAVRIYPEKEPSEADILASADGKNPAKYGDPDFLPPWYAFNIASLGLDAYVVHMTNTVKKKLPGNFYHLCVPLSGFTYDKVFPLGNAKIEMFGKDNVKTDEINMPFTLMAFGASGYRVYGGGHKVLPDENNFCLAPKISLWNLIKENHRFVDGSFKGTPIASLHTVEKIRLSYDKSILMQCDGETVMLTPAHFPLIIELTDPCLRVLKPVSL